MAVTRELGEIEGPLLVCGGAYGNLEATQALLAEAAARRIPASNILHTGDAVAYCADPADTAELLRSADVRAIKGNVEEQLAADASDCGCGFEEGSACDLISMQWYSHARAETGEGLRRWMAALPERLSFRMNERLFVVVHGAPSRINRYQFASLPEADFARELDLAGADCVIAGHTGLPFTRRIGDRIWHNPGALGLPANDGTPRVWFSLIVPARGAIRFEHHPLSFDHGTAARKMRARGLPEGYAQALSDGRWPSEDILPAPEREMAGRALTPRAAEWPTVSAPEVKAARG